MLSNGNSLIATSMLIAANMLIVTKLILVFKKGVLIFNFSKSGLILALIVLENRRKGELLC